jgi:hypothetical protein
LQTTVHVPFTQAPDPFVNTQIWPQPPQLATSLLVSMHWPPQLTWPIGHAH